MHNEAAISLPTVVEGDNIQSTPVESPPEHVSLPTGTPLFPETRAASHPTAVSSSHPPPSQPQPARLSLRFNTVMSSHSRQTFVIDISDDDEDEEEEESTQHALVTGSNNSTESSDSSLLANTPAPRSSPEQQPTVLQSVGTDILFSRPQCEHDVDPPFMTDGRGRVVWSSTRSASGRGAATEGRASRHSRTGSTSRVACPSPNSTLFVSNTRGHAWGGQDTQGVGGREQ